MARYRIGSWKLSVEDEFSNIEEAIKKLSDEYMCRSKCDPPGQHMIELLSGTQTRSIGEIGKCVYISIYDVNRFGNNEWQTVHRLTIHPFKKEHWWDDKKNEFVFDECEFRYSIEKDATATT